MTHDYNHILRDLINILTKLLQVSEQKAANEQKRAEQQIEPKSIDVSNRDFLTVGEVAAKSGFTQYTIRKWIKAGELKGVKIGKPWRIKFDDFQKFMQ